MQQSPTRVANAGPKPILDGYCPVTLKSLNKWAIGDAQYGAVHRGRTYLFAGAEQRVIPSRYSDSHSGQNMPRELTCNNARVAHR